jgi:hypothetical protein
VSKLTGWLGFNRMHYDPRFACRARDRLDGAGLAGISHSLRLLNRSKALAQGPLNLRGLPRAMGGEEAGEHCGKPRPHPRIGARQVRG